MNEKRNHPLLAAIHVAKPCHEDWESMTGTEQRRFCDKCALHVTNLSEMTSDEAESALAASSGKLCVRYRHDGAGSVWTRTGWVAGLAAAGALVALPLAGCGPTQSKIPPVQQQSPTLQGTPTPVPQPDAPETMGKVAPIPPEVMGEYAPSTTSATMGNVAPPRDVPSKKR